MLSFDQRTHPFEFAIATSLCCDDEDGVITAAGLVMVEVVHE